MSRRDNYLYRCARCRMLGALCICDQIPNPKLRTRTRLVLVIHRVEDRKSTNTGKLAAECLANSEILVRGHESSPTPPFAFDDSVAPLFLFPHDDAPPLTESFSRGLPVTLIVPDGNWRQASKVRKRVSGMSDVPCVSLPLAERSVHRLRAEAHETGLSTIEAIARAYGILEGAHVENALLHVWKAMVERTLWSRGSLTTEEVTGGIPAGTMRHDPRTPRK